MLQRLDPDSTFTHTLRPALRPDVTLRFRCRYLTMRQAMRVRESRAATFNLTDDAAYCAAIGATIAMVAVDVSGMPPDAAPGFDGLADVLTPRELSTLLGDIEVAQSVSEGDLGKSQSPPPTAAAASAGNAGSAGA